MHEIKIPSYIKESVLKRRGKLNIYERLNPNSCALLVIDMQNCFIIPGLSLVEVPGIEAIAPRINSLAKAVRIAGGKVIWTRHRYASEWSSWYNDFCDIETRKLIIEDTKEGAFPGKIWNGMEVKSEDNIIIKNRSSALAPDFLNLRNLSIQDLFPT